MTCIDRREIAGYVAGALADERARVVGAHVEQCPHCAGLHRSFMSLTGNLALDGTEAQDERLANDVLALVHSGRAERERFPVPAAPSRWKRHLRWWFAPAFAVPAIATVLLLAGGVGTKNVHDIAAGFRARGAAEDRADRWVSLEIFRAHRGGYERVDERIAADDALAFSYRDRSSPAFGYLLVFAIDEAAQVHWYYPASAEDKAASVALTGNAEADLPDQVRHRLGQGALRMFAIFSREPLQALAVEKVAQAELKRLGSLAGLRRLPLTGAGQHAKLLVVAASDGATP